MRPERAVIGVEKFFRIGLVFAFPADLALDAFGYGFPRRPAGRSFLALRGFEGLQFENAVGFQLLLAKLVLRYLALLPGRRRDGASGQILAQALFRHRYDSGAADHVAGAQAILVKQRQQHEY